MPRRAQADSETAVVRDRVIVLGLVNTLQPVRYDVLAEAMSTRIDRRGLKALVDSLKSQGMLSRLSTEEYVVARKGRDALSASPFKTRRDISRMQYLFQRSKGGGVKA